MSISKSVLLNIILGVACLIMGYFLFFNNNQISGSQKVIKSLRDSLKKENAEYMSAVTHYRNQVISAENKIDSLNKINARIDTQYIPVYEKINMAHFGWLSAQFDSLFSVNNIK